jgi:uncharacterized protein (DUF2235 family)
MSDHICRRLILLLDGTWNEDEDDVPSSNIVYLRERLFWGVQTRLRDIRKKPSDKADYEALPALIRQKGVNGFIFDGFEYFAYYDRGVGTGAYLDVVKGGLTGDGLDDNIREAYRFLSTWFRPGDEIFVFGFSRGSFTARSLCGYIQASGLLRPQFCTTENEERAWAFYRKPPGQRAAAEWLHFRSPPEPGDEPLVYDESYTRIRILGVFDTVGALGIPVQGLRRVNRAKYEFHDPEANSIVDVRLHAVAIDEPRRPFSPTLWTKPKFKRISARRSPTEQVWFSGAHADIGGGYVKWNQGNDELGLSHVSLAWMLQRVRYHIINTPSLAVPPADLNPSVKPTRGAAIPFYDIDLLDSATLVQTNTEDGKRWGTPDREISKKVQGLVPAMQHVPWAALSTVMPNIRPINQIPLTDYKSDEQQGRVAYADPIGEAIHISALTRLAEANAVAIDRGRLAGAVHAIKGMFVSNEERYRPKNLLNIIPYLAAAYLSERVLDQKLEEDVRNKRADKDRCDKGWNGHVFRIYSWKHIRVVDWDGRVLDPASLDEVLKVFAILPTPGEIGVVGYPPGMDHFKVIEPQPTASAPAGGAST